MLDFIVSPLSSAMPTATILPEQDTRELTNSMPLILLGLSFLLTQGSYIKLHLATSMKKKSGGLLNGAFWLNILNVKEIRHIHIMLNTWLTWPPLDNLTEVARLTLATLPLREPSGICLQAMIEVKVKS